MAEDLTPKIVQQYDTSEFLPGGHTRQVTVVQFVIGRFGPFEAKFDRTATRFDIEQVMNARRDILQGHV